MESLIEVRVPYKKKRKNLYNTFDERARLENMVAILEKELNFHTL